MPAGTSRRSSLILGTNRPLHTTRTTCSRKAAGSCGSHSHQFGIVHPANCHCRCCSEFRKLTDAVPHGAAIIWQTAEFHGRTVPRLAARLLELFQRHHSHGGFLLPFHSKMQCALHRTNSNSLVESRHYYPTTGSRRNQRHGTTAQLFSTNHAATRNATKSNAKTDGIH